MPPNPAGFLFLDDRAPTVFLDWENLPDDAVAALRIQAGHNPHDKSLTDMVGELATKSDEFRTRWTRQRQAPPHRPETGSATPLSATSSSPAKPWN
jgi:MmyB-like transcription regulator ligand binding domain